ncbi:MAG: NAD-glutamate dehydrogenase, partial [Pseudomonadota bacterium]
MTSSHLAELLSYVDQHTGPASERQSGFVATYFENSDPDEIIARGPASLFALANAHWRLLDTPRPEQGVKVRVFNPTLAEDGFVSDHTVVQIVNDNMPFLVDSVTMAINRSGRTAHWIVHPLMSVARDADGSIASVSTVALANAAKQKNLVESLILVECDRIVGAAEQQALADDLRHVLADVR